MCHQKMHLVWVVAAIVCVCSIHETNPNRTRLILLLLLSLLVRECIHIISYKV